MSQNTNKINKIKFYFIFISILLISILTRLFKITSVPPSLCSDEIDASYHALVFNQCRTDYYGRRYPIHFKSDADYQSPATIYSIALSQKLFGLTDFSARLPTAIFGILTCLAFYLIGLSAKNSYLGLAMFFASSINPWLIHYSRINFGAMGMLLFISLSLLFFIKFIKKTKITYAINCFIFLIISTYFYSTAKVFVLLVGLVFLINTYQKLTQISFKKLIASLVIIFLISAPMAWSTLKGESGYRFSYINIFSNPTTSSQVDHYRYLDINNGQLQAGAKTPFLSKVFHNKYLSITKTFLNNYFSSLSTNFLFIAGDDNLRHGFKNFGYFYYIEFLFIIIGLFYLIKNHKNKVNTIILFFLIFAPIPSSLTRDSSGPHATRLIILSIPFIFLIAGGIYYFFKNSSILLKSVLAIIYLFSFFSFYHFYILDYPHISAQSWGVGTKETIQKVSQISGNYQKIFLSDKYQSPLFFYLYYTNTVPSCNIHNSLEKENDQLESGFSLNQKYYFGKINWDNLSITDIQNSLFIVTETDINTVKTKLLDRTINTIYTQPNRYETEPKFIFFTIN